MIIACPNCSTGYLLPEDLVGPGGARVRCPRCQQPFAVDADGLPRATPGADPAAAPDVPAPVGAEPVGTAPTAAAALPCGAENPLVVARAVLDQLAEREGEAIEHARAERRLFADFGPALMAAYETYRRRAGADAGPGAFREALRERWGVELVPFGVSGE